MKSLKLVCVGGGTGLSSLLKGFKRLSTIDPDAAVIINIDELSAIVTVSDDGGSTGRLVDEFDVLPPGDIRKLLVSLSDSDKLVSSLFEYRFSSDGPLGGHNIGNLLLIALTELNDNNFPRAIQLASQLLAVRGQIIPVSLQPTILCAELIDEEIIRGESMIPGRKNRSPIRRIFLEPRPNGKTNKKYEVKAHQASIDSINDADVIIIGPGSLYTSIMPNLVYPEIRQAFSDSSAVKVYICNVMSQPGETDNYSVTEHVKAITSHAKIDLDYVIVNDGMASPQVLKNYIQKEISGQLDLIRKYTDEGLIMSSKQGNLTSNPPIDFFDHISSLSEQISQLSSGITKIASTSQVQVLFDPQKDHLDGAQLVTADMIYQTKVVVDQGIELDVVRHDPMKLATTLVKVIGDHFDFS